MGYIEDLKEHEKFALWFQTDEGWDWIYDNAEDSKEHPPVYNADIAHYVVKEYLYSKAKAWSNKRIRAFLDWY